MVFANMADTANDIAQTIGDNKPTDMNVDLYKSVIDIVGFTEYSLMVALSFLVNDKVQVVFFVGMHEKLGTHLAKHC
jgi:hypothetical protein